MRKLEIFIYSLTYFVLCVVIYFLLDFDIFKGFASLIFGVVAMGFIMNKFDKDVRFFKGK